MTENSTGRGGRLVVVLLVAVLLLPPAYILSIGPALWLFAHDYLSADAVNAYAIPANTLSRYCPPLRDALHWYASQFVPMQPLTP
jgi:hypothetical protein